MIDIDAMKKRCKEDSDPSLVAFMVRSDDETKAAGLVDLAWELSISGYTTTNDVLYLLELIERWRKNKNT